MKPSIETRTTPGVCETWTLCGAQAEANAPADLLIETPHGATRARDYELLRARLRGPLPEELETFFFVNTDVGSFEVARAVAESVIDRRPTQKVVVLRCLIPRTFVDCNRLLRPEAGHHEMTPALPDYLRDREDRELLGSLHGQYLQVARGLYDAVCGQQRLGLALHTYAPRSVSVERLDGAIVQTLRRAYAPERYASWPRRPDVDVISELVEGTLAAPRRLVDALKQRYAHIGVEAAENATYRLHPSTLGYVHSVRYPGRVVCVELNRELLADPFTPFEEMRISSEKTDRMAAPLVEALIPEMVAVAR